MPRGPLSDEHKAKMQAARKAKQAELRKLQEMTGEKTPESVDLVPEIQVADKLPETPVTPVEPKDPTMMLLERLMAEIDELKKARNPDATVDDALRYQAQMQGQPTVGKNGIQGKQFLYPIEKSFYPDPTPRLYTTPELKRFGLGDNYFFDWNVEGVEYDKYNITWAQPKFTVRLFKKLYDDEGQENGKMAFVSRNIYHEDESMARAAADKLGMTEAFGDMRELMDEMRYRVFRDWLISLFQKPKVELHNRRPYEDVIGGKVVTIYDTEELIDGEDGQSKASSLGR